MMADCEASKLAVRRDLARLAAWCSALFWVLSKEFTSTSSRLPTKYSTTVLLLKVAAYISAVMPRTSQQFRSGLPGSPRKRATTPPLPSASFFMPGKSPATAASSKPFTLRYLGTNSTPEVSREPASVTLPMRSSPCFVAMLIQPSTPRPLSARAEIFARRLLMLLNCMIDTKVPGLRMAFSSLSRGSSTRTVTSDFTSCCEPTSKRSTRKCMSELHLATVSSLPFPLKLIQPCAL
mmetsp:Transcript_51143/g.163730  ORF Transcript_51143/g.163730 Transcript_51143/m.163730 type:complete len:236 (+) Transcript_51143:256-963(+)